MIALCGMLLSACGAGADDTGTHVGRQATKAFEGQGHGMLRRLYATTGAAAETRFSFALPLNLYGGDMLPAPGPVQPDFWLGTPGPVYRVELTADPDAVTPKPKSMIFPGWQLTLPVWIEPSGLRTTAGSVFRGQLRDDTIDIELGAIELGGFVIERLRFQATRLK